ncbi:DUF1836 domain-containing protein [Merdimonas faecis]|uniref:DUF1836 domain-containing protein n=1 Tax=Merdimonas faecis TaxID=1653435 RepID=UPI0022E6072E|nr:DUF1836 domain-containing protein [Merdimonas faecis]
MTIDTKDLLNSILSSISRIDYIRPNEIPNIDLYMDQVTTFMEEQLKRTKRYEEDKILTKTMINNYAKNNLLPPPVKKKYSKEHVLVMIFIYYFKNILSIKDIESVLTPITEKTFDKEESLDMTSVYEEICQMEKSRIDDLKKDVTNSYELAMDSFSELPPEEKEYFQLFAFICNLSFDVYVKKQIIEKMIDDLADADSSAKKKK